MTDTTDNEDEDQTSETLEERVDALEQNLEHLQDVLAEYLGMLRADAEDRATDRKERDEAFAALAAERQRVQAEVDQWKTLFSEQVRANQEASARMIAGLESLKQEQEAMTNWMRDKQQVEALFGEVLDRLDADRDAFNEGLRELLDSREREGEGE